MLMAEDDTRLIDAQNAVGQRDYRCPACHGIVRLHQGTQVIPYFAHLPQETCPVNGEGETVEHMAGKRELAAFFAEWGPTQLERILPSVGQRADVWVAHNAHPVAIEFQCSPLAFPQVRERTAGYQRLGIYPFWILGRRYAHQRLGWSIISRFACWLPRWALCLLFWEEETHQLWVHHHLRQDATGHYIGDRQVIKTLRALREAQPQFTGQPQVTIAAVRRRFWRGLLRGDTRLRDIQEQLYKTGHHLGMFPSVFWTTATSPVGFGLGLLSWRIVVGNWLLTTHRPLTVSHVKELANRGFTLVHGQHGGVRFSYPRLVTDATTELLHDFVGAGLLRATDQGWDLIGRPTWRQSN